MDTKYTVDRAEGGVGFILRDGDGNVVREHHGMPLAFLTRADARKGIGQLVGREALLRAQDRMIEEGLS